jgi:hypothetical protein
MYEGKQASYSPIGNQPAMIGAISDAVRQLELPAELEKMAKVIEFLDHGLNELSQRMEGKVLRPSVPEPAPGNQIAAVGPSTFYGQELHSSNRRINNMAERIQDLIRRLEI